MIHIEKNTYDKSYPYTLGDAWGGKICCDEEDLRKLQKELNKMFPKKSKKPLDKQPKVCYNEYIK